MPCEVNPRLKKKERLSGRFYLRVKTSYHRVAMEGIPEFHSL
jgi:hypothetical protein